MRATAALAVLAFLVCLTPRVFPQEPGKAQAQAQCKFSDGNTLRVTQIAERKTYQLATDEPVLTVTGISVPAGHYAVLPVKDPRNGSWTLKMRSEVAKGESGELAPVPMSVVRSVGLRQLEPSAPSEGGFTVSFNQTGGSCMMHWRSDKPDMVLSVEFTEKNADLPVEQ